MELADFAAEISGFEKLEPREQIRLFGWFLHAHQNAGSFDNDAMRGCFRKLGMVVPDVSVYMPRMANRKPPDLIRHRGAYQLARPVRLAIDAKYGTSPTRVTITRLLADLPAKVPDHVESVFLVEGLNCYKVGAYRAATVMVWNLAFHHVLKWVMAEPQRLSNFNQALAMKFSKKATAITTAADFEELREADIIEVCRIGRLFSKNIVDVLREKLKRRNQAAHPSALVVSQGQADDTISDLVNNVVLNLK